MATELVVLYGGRGTSIGLMNMLLVLLVEGGTVRLVWRQEGMLEGRDTTVELRFWLLIWLLTLLLSLVLCILPLLVLQEKGGSVLIYKTNRNNIWTWYLLSV